MAGTANLKSFPPRRVSPRRPVTKSEVHPEVRGPLPSTASNTQVRMEHGVFLAWTLSTQMLQAGLQAHSFSKRSQELNKATRGLRTKAEGRSPIIQK